MFDRFTDKARAAMGKARQEAEIANCDRIETPHLLLGLSNLIGSSAEEILRKCLTHDSLKEQLKAILSKGFREGRGRTHLPFSLHMKKALEAAEVASCNTPIKTITTLHLLWGIVDPETSACTAQQSFGETVLENLRYIVKNKIQMGDFFPSDKEWDVTPALRDAVYLHQEAIKEYETLEANFLKEDTSTRSRESFIVLLASLETKIKILEKLIAKAAHRADLGELPRLTKMLTELEKKNVGTD